MALQTTVDRARIEDLASDFSGQFLLAGEAGYDEARQLHNGMIDRHPAVIARCLGTSDVVRAVRFATANALEIAVRGGGHNVAGNACCDDGMMIDLSLMKGIHVDPVARTCRAQGGATWAEFNRETQLHGLACTGGEVSSTGIAGLTLGGGFGWLMGKHGLAIDNLIGAEIVTADGEVLNVSADEHPDLFWGIRGGGGNFGVAASLEYRLHPVGQVLSGLVAHPITKAGDVLRFFREFTASLPDDATAFAGLLHAPDGSGVQLAAIIVCHSGSMAEAEATLRPLREFGPPMIDAIAPNTYSATNAMLDAGFPKGALSYWKSSFLEDLDDAAIDTIAEQFSACPSPMSGLVLEHVHGAVTRVGVTETAFPHRSTGYNLLVVSEWLDPAQSAVNIAWARAAFDAMRPFQASGRYVNYLGEGEGEDSVAAAYGANYERLRAVKRKYDPDNVFHMNQNIRPA
ncbi:MAG: FAD-binding oxidoreductase [Tepidiformaceae bacterium]